MKRIAMVALALTALAAGPAAASCYGTESYKTCRDDSGNRYTVQSYGDATSVRGYNYETGSSWSQRTNRVGDTSYTRGYDADGNSWNSSSRTSGNTTYQRGYDSDGNYFNNTIRRNGSSTTYSGTDSDGNYYYKTCTSLGCY